MQGEIQSFVVRIWPEAVDGDGKATAWRGSIEHVGSDRRIHFQDLDRIVLFIQQAAGMDGREPDIDAMSVAQIDSQELSSLV